MKEITGESLKAEAAQHLAELRIGSKHLSGEARELAILAMCSFACKVVAREVAQLFAKEPS